MTESNEAAQPDGSAVDPEWLALLDRAGAGGEDAQGAVCDAYSRGIGVGLRRAADAVLPAAIAPDETLSGLEPEQEVRARALEIAVTWVGHHWIGGGRDRNGILGVADTLGDYIRDGSRPGVAEPCTCERVAPSKYNLNPACPQHGEGSRPDA